MSAPAVTVEAGRPLFGISQLFAEKQINRVPVVDAEGRIIGFVSSADMVHSFFVRIC